MKTTILFSLCLILLLVLKPNVDVHAGQALPVHISPGGDVDNEVVNVSRSAGDEVVWSSGGDDFTVSFTTSPFAASTFHVPAGGSISSGPVRAGAGVGRYHYFINDNTLGQSGDPDVDVRH